MKRVRDEEGKKLDAHAQTVEQAKKVLKELETLLNHHEAFTAALRAKMDEKRKK